MKTIIILISIAMVGWCQVEQCHDPTYIIPYQTLDNVFDSFNDARSQENLISLIEDPNDTTARNYILSLAPYAAPLFVLAAITFLVFVGGIIQVLCFNTCGKDCCGNYITTSTYNPCCLRTMTYGFLSLSFLLLAMSIAALIINSDLQQSITFTSCNTENILYQAYNGNTNTSISWSGVNNFGPDIKQFGDNLVNVVPALKAVFSTPNFDRIVDNSSTSAFNLSQTYNCQNSSGVTVNCPFPDPSTCSSTYVPEFSLQFCDPDINGSAQNLIQQEMDEDSATWRTGIINIRVVLDNAQIDQNSINNLTTQISNFTSSVTNYQQNLEDGFNQAQGITYNIQIAFYVFYSCLLAGALLTITSTCCIYCCSYYKCNCLTYVWWVFYLVMGVVVSIGAGLFFSASIFTYDTCTSYPYYFQNQTNFKQLTFASGQAGEIFENCFFENATSIFDAFQDSSFLEEFQLLKELYDEAVPPTSFSSVVSSVQATLALYDANPNTVIIADVGSEQQPAQALQQSNLFSDYTVADSTQTCNVTEDKLVFSPINCAPLEIEHSVGDAGCVVLSSAYNIDSITSGRKEAFDEAGCSSEGNTYTDNVDALLSYQQSINQIVSNIYSVEPDSSNPLQQYESNYFNFYTFVRNFFNAEVQALFASIFDPYDSLYDGSSCGFITSSMDGIINTACNQMFPYVNAFSALNIAIAIDLFLLMVLAYFLTTRYQFYEELQGNLDNYGEEIAKNSDSNNYQFDSTRQNQNQFITNTDRQE